MVEGLVRRGWKGVAGASGEGSRVGWEVSELGFEGGCVFVSFLVQRWLTSARRKQS